jgi:hypothetical protein
MTIDAGGASSETAEVGAHADANCSDEQRPKLAVEGTLWEQTMQSGRAVGPVSQQAPDTTTNAADERQVTYAEELAPAAAAPLTASEVAARIEVVKRRMLANAAPAEVESIAAFVQTLQR